MEKEGSKTAAAVLLPRFLLVFLSLSMLALVLAPFPTMATRGLFFDEALWMLNGGVMADGGRLYVNAFDHKPPLINVAYELMVRLGRAFPVAGDPVLSAIWFERIAAVTLTASTAALVFLTTRRAWRLRPVWSLLAGLGTIALPIFRV